MIIWLASYPKSGNTWVRSFLSTLIYSKQGENNFDNLKKIKQFPDRTQFDGLVNNYDNINEIAENWIRAQEIINLDGKIKILKTHNMNCTIGNNNFTDHKNSIGVIHIVRDPRNIITSIKNHYSFPDIEYTKNFMFNERATIHYKKESKVTKSFQIYTPLGSWKTHYHSWKNKTKNYMLIRYEDLISDPKTKFYEISSYIARLVGIIFNDDKIKKSIDSSSFKFLQKLEDDGLFQESAIDKKNQKKIKFFRLGPDNKWQNFLNKSTVKEIDNSFFKELKELKYI